MNRIDVYKRQALRLLGITAQTPSPAGGKIEVKNGELTGYVEENALIPVSYTHLFTSSSPWEKRRVSTSSIEA